MFFAYLILILLLIFSLTLLVAYGSVIVGLVMAKGVPFVSLPKHDWVKMCEVAQLQPGQRVYDLGCGKANLLVTASKQFGAKGIGYEISLWPYLWGRFRSWRQHAKLELHLGNFMSADLSTADVVFCYLFPSAMARLEPKFEKELKPGAKVVSYAFKLPKRSPVETIDGAENGVGRISVYRY
jgi:hypothetical protein